MHHHFTHGIVCDGLRFPSHCGADGSCRKFPKDQMPTLPQLRYLLGLTIALMFSVIFVTSYLYDGSSISKYFTTQAELERVQETKIEAYTDQMLFGDELEKIPQDVDLTEKSSTDEGLQNAEKIRQIDNGVIFFLMVASWLILMPPFYGRRWFSCIYLLLGFYVLCLSIFKGVNGGSMFSELSVMAHSSRWLPCFAMWVWVFFDIKVTRSSFLLVIILLVIATCLTFATHGYEAFNEHPKFRDLIYGSFGAVSIPLSDSMCDLLLKLIGIKDVCLAIAVVFCIYRREIRWVLLWMAFWGILTAITRPIALNDVGWLDALLRVGNGVTPLLIYFLLKHLNTNVIQNDETS